MHVILFLAANPRSSHPRKLAEECAQIERELKMTPHRADFRFESRWAVGVDELMRHLTELDPTVIHFSGDGEGSAGLLFEDEQGQPQPVSSRALAMVVETTARNARAVVLNACYSAEQAMALRAKVDCVVGMDGAIGDDAARAFAIRFYGALGNRRSIGNAVDQGIAALAARQLPDEVLPRCLTRAGTDAHRIFLGPSSSPSSPVERPRLGLQSPARTPAADAAMRARVRTAFGRRGHATPNARRDQPVVRDLPCLPADVRVLSQPRPEDAARTRDLLREMHARLLTGYAADAVTRAVHIVEMAIKVLTGLPSSTPVALGDLIDELRHRGRFEFLADARWLCELRTATEHLLGQVHGDRDRDGRRAAEIAIRFALITGLVTASDASECQSSAAWEASKASSSALLRLDRAAHRKALDDLLVLPRRVAMVLIHGEVDQGHDHFAEIMTWRLRSASNGRWQEILIRWPPQSRSLGTRLAMLFEELAKRIGVKLVPPTDDPATPEGARAWAPALAPIVAALDARRERLFLHHVVRWLRTGAGGDDALIDAYVRAIWAGITPRSDEQIVVGFDLRRIERRGLPLTRPWRIAREELAAARAIERVLDRHQMSLGGTCLALPELRSVPVPDLVDWLRAEGGRSRDSAVAEATQLVSSTRGGRFDLVVQRLTALNLDRQRETK